MITIQTATGRIIDSNGALLSGHIVITPSSEFEYDESAVRRKVTMTPMRVNFTNGQLLDGALQPITFDLVPTVNANHDRTGLYHVAEFFSGGSNWTEYWSIDATGGSPIELTSITQVVP